MGTLGCTAGSLRRTVGALREGSQRFRAPSGGSPGTAGSFVGVPQMDSRGAGRLRSPSAWVSVVKELQPHGRGRRTSRPARQIHNFRM